MLSITFVLDEDDSDTAGITLEQPAPTRPRQPAPAQSVSGAVAVRRLRRQRDRAVLR